MATERQPRRGKTRPTKDRVLQARIPRHLDEELRGHAEQLGISVSTVVRNVLLNTFELVEGVVADSAQIARAMQGRSPRALPPPDNKATDPEPEVIGWQELVLNRNGICEACNAILHKGERAAMGLPARAKPELLCPACLAQLTAGAAQTPEQP